TPQRVVVVLAAGDAGSARAGDRPHPGSTRAQVAVDRVERCDVSTRGRRLRVEPAQSRTDPAANRSSGGESMKRAITCASLIALGIVGPSSLRALHAQSPTVPSDADIRQILVDRIDRDRQSVGIVVGVIEKDGSDPRARRVITYGALEKGDSRPLTGDTIFEIGSVTKVFTSLVLAGMVKRGEVALTDPVAKYLPADVKMPERNGRAITLQDLATHTSGLPRLPTNFTPMNPANP